MWQLFQIVTQLAFLLLSPVFLGYLITPYLVERIRHRRGDGGPILATVRDDGWHPVDVAVYDALVSQPAPRSWSIWDQIKTETPASWFVYAWAASGVGAAITGWSLGIVALPFCIMFIGGAIVLVRARRHGAVAIATVDSIRGPLFVTYGTAPLTLAKASLGARGDTRNRVSLPWRPCRLLLDRHGHVQVMVLLDRRGKPVNVLAIRPAP